MPSVVQATKATFSSPVGDLPSSYSQGRRGSLMWKCFRRPHSILLRSMKRNKEINLIKRRTEATVAVGKRYFGLREKFADKKNLGFSSIILMMYEIGFSAGAM